MVKRKKLNSDENEDDETMSYVNNCIYFYTDVSLKNVMKLNQMMKEIEKMGHNDIHLYINSSGGDIYAGFTGFNHIKHSKNKIHTYCDGMCASAATFLLLAGDERHMFEYSELLIHQISTGTWGKYEELCQDLENNKTLMKLVRTFYDKHTEIPKKVLDELLTKEINLSSSLCKKYNIIDEII